MNSIKTVIIDDEKLAREDLKSLLKDFPEIEIHGEADNTEKGIRLIEEEEPDLIFLDIQMPGETGFDLLRKIKTDKKIIFVTAYEQFAIRAFEVNAQDYLLKPVNKDRLAISINKLKNGENNHIDKKFKPLEFSDTIFLLINNSYQFIKINSIIKINSAGNYSELHTRGKGRGLVLKSMKEWEERLPENKFVRIHRNTIINLEYLDRIEEWFNYAFQVYLKEFEKPETMSRRYAALLKGRME